MTLYDLTSEPVTSTDGVDSGYLGRRFVVQIAKAVGDVLGDDLPFTLGSIEWVDVTDAFAGGQITRGSQAGSRPGAGEFSFRLLNDTGEFDPWESQYHGPGTLVRIMLDVDGGTTALVTGLTIEWSGSSDAATSHRFVDITALETLSLLGEVNNLAGSLVGGGEFLVDRVGRLLDSADWSFGATLDGSNPWSSAWGFQSTDLSANTLTEMYLTVDSVAMQVYSDKNGNLVVNERATGFAANSEFIGLVVPVVSDSIITANDDERLLGEIAVSREGGTATTYVNGGIAGRYQKRSTQRFDLITQDPGADEDTERYADVVLGYSAETYRALSFAVTTLHGNQSWFLIQQIDPGLSLNLFMPTDRDGNGILFSNYIVAGYTLDILPLNTAGIQITATIETDVSGEDTLWGIYSDDALWDGALWDNANWV